MNRLLAMAAVAVALGIGGWFAWSQLYSAPAQQTVHKEGDAHAEGEEHKEGEAAQVKGEEHKEGEAAHAEKEGAGHDGEGKGNAGAEAHASEAKVVALTPAQRKEAGIVVEVVRPGPLSKAFRAPGEVRTNDYSTNSVTARHQAIVAERKAKLGDKVTKGQPLVGLFSAEMAEAQTAYVLAVQEYRRVQQLGRDIVAARRFNEADGKRRETRAKLETFGFASSQIDALAANGRSDHPAGQFDIVAPQAGTIVSDDFRLGSVVEPGKVLFVITNPDNVWIEAHVSPNIATEIAGEFAKVHAGSKEIVARVVQVQQQIDESTRTVGVRLEAASVDGALKPGLFVDVELYGKAELVTSLPTDAIVRGPDGDWTIYVENAKGEFEPKEIETLYTVGARTVISGIAPGAKVVTSGAFFVMAEAAKAGFDPHGH